jgi:hypothetical protein
MRWASSQLTQQRQRDDALSASGAAGNDDDLLGVRTLSSPDGMQDKVVRHLLLVEQDELLTVLDLGRRHLEQLLGRAHGARQQTVAGSGAAVRRELIAQIFQKGASSALGKQPGSLGRGQSEEVVHIEIGRVVEVGDAAYRAAVPVQGSREVGDVIAITLHLEERMLQEAMHSLDHDQPFVVFVQLGLAPLLELDNDVRILAGPPVHAREHDVGPLAGERKLVFDQHLDLAETGLDEVMSQYREAALPGFAL